MEAKWPALAIQSIILATNISFLLSGQGNRFILASVTIVLILFAIQSMSKNERFIWLFPMRFPERIRTSAIDTWILRILLVLSILFFYIGATNSYVFPIFIVIFGIGFPLIWDKYFNKYNEEIIADIVKKEKQKMPDEIRQQPTLLLIDEKGQVIWKMATREKVR